MRLGFYNRLRWVSLIKAIVHMSFIVLFAGFWGYHTLLGVGISPPFLGGYFTNVSLLLFTPVFWIYLLKSIRYRSFLGITDVFFLLFILYFFFTVGANYVLGADPLIVRKHMTFIVQFLVVYMILKMVDVESPRFVLCLFFCYIVMSVIVFYYSVGGRFYLQYSHPHVNSDMVASYQAFAMVYLLIVLVLIASQKSKCVRYGIYLTSISAMYLIAARAEFAALLLLIPAIEFYQCKNRFVFIVTIVTLGSFIITALTAIVKVLPDNRILLLLTPKQDSSRIVRDNLFRLGFDTIANNPIMGDYASYPYGYYVHNIFSAWVDLGVIGFIFLFLLLTLSLLRQVYICLWYGHRSSALLLSVSLLGTTLLLLFVAKSYTYQLIPAALGAYSGYCYKMKTNKKHA